MKHCFMYGIVKTKRTYTFFSRHKFNYADIFLLNRHTQTIQTFGMDNALLSYVSSPGRF